MSTGTGPTRSGFGSNHGPGTGTSYLVSYLDLSTLQVTTAPYASFPSTIKEGVLEHLGVAVVITELTRIITAEEMPP